MNKRAILRYSFVEHFHVPIHNRYMLPAHKILKLYASTTIDVLKIYGLSIGIGFMFFLGDKLHA